MGRIANRPTGFDGYTSVIPKSAGTVAKILGMNGYSTAMFGKSHLTPDWELTPLGPFDRWPTGLGFDYFWGFPGFDTNMWAPQLIENTTYIEPPKDTPLRHFDGLLADRTIEWIAQQRAVAPERPFFAYYATGTAHTPHHAPEEWMRKYRGRFDKGWDQMREATFARQKACGAIPQDAKLTARPDAVQSWDSLSERERKTAARLMEAYAAALDYCDHEVGRVLDSLREMGEFDNTLVIFIQGDNGGSAEGGLEGFLYEQSWTNALPEDPDYVFENLDKVGGPDAYSHFPAAWGWAMNTPFQYYKQVASHFGGMRNGMVMSWPDGFKGATGDRSQFHHVSDVVPTVLEAAGIRAPGVIDGVEQDPMDGISMLYSAAQDGASKKSMQLFECLENFAIYKDGWMANVVPSENPWADMTTRKPSPDARTRPWELYHIAQDYSQAVDLAEENPGKLEELKALFWSEAEREKIAPLHGPIERTKDKPMLARGKDSFTFRPGVKRLHHDAAPLTQGRSFEIEADVEIAEGQGNGVLVSQGSKFSGYTFYMKDGHLVFHYNAVLPNCFEVRSPATVAAGRHSLKVRFDIDEPKVCAGGSMTLFIDGQAVAEARAARTLRTFSNQDGFNVGCDTVTPVCPDYTIATSAFDARLATVTVRLM